MHEKVPGTTFLKKTTFHGTVILLHEEKLFIGRKKRQNGKEKGTEMKGGEKWEYEKLIWKFKYRKLFK